MLSRRRPHGRPLARTLVLCVVGALAFGCAPAGGTRQGSDSGSGATGELPEAAPSDADSHPPGSTCKAGVRSCQGNAVVECVADGSGWGAPEPCAEGKVCGPGGCIECKSGFTFCQGTTPIECDDAGLPVRGAPCSDGTECANGHCVTCVPGKKECRESAAGEQETWECQVVDKDTVDWKKTATCPEGADCINGLCLQPCSSDVKLNTNQGCDYYAVDLENSASEPLVPGSKTAADSQFAVIVSNPNQKIPITVTVHEKQAGPAIATREVAPADLEVIKLNKRNVVGTLKGFLAWRIKADHPFVAYQFNPLDNVNPVYSNDATLLLPGNALGKEYLVMTGWGGGAFLTVVGTKAATKVTVTVTAPTADGDGIPALAAGETFTGTLDAGEVLNLRAKIDANVNETLTGSIVTADQNVLVFGGNVVTNTGGRCCADHLEMQLFPTQSWGTTYVCGKSQPRGVEVDYWRILARDDGTTVSFSSGVENPKKLDRGEFVDLATDADFVVTSDKPVLVGQFLASSFEVEPEGVWCDGDDDCKGGRCTNPEAGAGMCLSACNSESSGCGNSEVCVATALLGADSGAPPDSHMCLHKLCAMPGKPKCPTGTTCVTMPDDDFGRCYDTCSVADGFCAGSLSECIDAGDYGVLCAEQACTSNGGCPGGWCNPSAADSTQGSCWKKCTPAGQCKKPGELCLPAVYNSDSDVGKDLCLEATCTSDTDCDASHTCAKGFDPETGKAWEEGYCRPIGDPSFILSVPTQQYRTDYVFLTPEAYKQNFVNILAPATAQVAMDGLDVGNEKFTTVAGTTWKVARLKAPAGVHTVKASAPVGVIVYGYHKDVSYGYPGGANLHNLGK